MHCFVREIKDILVSVQAIDKIENIFTIPANQINFEYRNNDLSEFNILSASSKEKKGSEEIKKMFRRNKKK